MHRDPVCGRRMNRNKAYVVKKYKGKVYLLCCPLCQSEFEKNPDKYVVQTGKK
ncbi:MAG: YHS domain-containing protein [bacterium]